MGRVVIGLLIGLILGGVITFFVFVGVPRAGSTPATIVLLPSTSITRSTIAGSRPKPRRQKASLSRTTGGAPGRSSSMVYKRPAAGLTPSAPSAEADANAAAAREEASPARTVTLENTIGPAAAKACVNSFSSSASGPDIPIPASPIRGKAVEIT